MTTADIVLDVYITIAVLWLLFRPSAVSKGLRRIQSQELNSADVTHVYRRIQRP